MAVHIEIQTVIMETNKHEVLSESKFVAWYQKYMHINPLKTSDYYSRVTSKGQNN